MSNAGSHGGQSNPKPPAAVVMAAYDQLPPIVRAAVRDAALDWDTTAIHNALNAGTDPRGLPAYIAAYERQHLRSPS